MGPVDNQTIINLDVDEAKRQIPGADRDTLLVSLHKARVELGSAPRELRHESVHWLRERGYCRLYGLPLPPEGELP